MKISLIISAVLLSATLSACDERPDKAPVPHTEKAPAAGLFQDERNALEKAKTVEKTLEKRSEEDKRVIEQQTR